MGGQLARGADFLPQFRSHLPLKSKSWNNGSGPVRFPAFPKIPSVPIADTDPERSTASNLIKMADVGQWQQSLLGGFTTTGFFFFYCLRHRDASGGTPAAARPLSDFGPGQSRRPGSHLSRRRLFTYCRRSFLTLPCTDGLKGGIFQSS